MSGVFYKLLGFAACAAVLALAPTVAPAKKPDGGDAAALAPGGEPAATQPHATGGAPSGAGQEKGRGGGKAGASQARDRKGSQGASSDKKRQRQLASGSAPSPQSTRPTTSTPGTATPAAPTPEPAPAPAAAAPGAILPGAPAAPGQPATPAPGAPAAGGGGTTDDGAGGASGAPGAGGGVLGGGAGGAGPFAALPTASSGGGGDESGGDRDRRAPRREPVTRTVVRSVEQVVEVIPGFVWALIGALAAFAVAAAAASSLLAARARGLARQREALLRDVGLLQEALLPAAPEQVAGAAATVAYRPGSGDRTGSDFYDVFAIDDRRLGIVVGRVSAGGRRALGVTAHIRHVLRAYLEGGLRPRNALQVGAEVLENHLGPDYACVSVAVYDGETSELTWAGAGMPAPVIAGAAAFEPVSVGAAPPIGMGVPTGTRQTTMVLPPGAMACLYTDGLTDAVVDGERYGYRRLWRAVQELDDDAGADALLEHVAAESARAGDDMAAVVLRAGGAPPAADAGDDRRVEELELSARELRGERPVLFMRDCGVPTTRIPVLAEELREEGRRLGGIVLRVHFGAGVPEADLALRSMDVLHAPSGGPAAPVPEVSGAPGRSGG